MADVRITQYPLKSIVSDNDIFLIADSNDVDVNGFLKYKKVRAKDLPSIVNTAENITYANLMAAIAADDLIIGTFYRITDSASGVTPLLVQAVGVDAIGYLAFDGTNPLVTINYDVMTDTIRWSLNQIIAPISLGSLSATTPLSYNNTTGVFTISQSNTTTNGYLSSADWNTFTAKQNALSGTGLVKSTSGTISYITDNSSNWNTAYNDSIVSAAVTGTTTKLLTLNQQDGGTITASWSDFDTAPVTSVFGRTGDVISANGDYTTTQVTEGTNLYYLDTRARASISNTVTGLTYTPLTGVLSTTAGYGIPTTATQANWDTAYTNRITSASAPLAISSNAISISQANGSTNGYLSSTDWTTFNSKQDAGNYITALTGEATASGPNSASVTLTNSAVIGKVLTGLNITGGSVSASDSILTAFGKTQNQINALVGGVMFQSVWDAATNNPILTSSVGTKGYYYIVNVAGSTNLNGITSWNVGDWAIFDGTVWQKVDNTDAVSSVNGQTGAVSLTTTNISEGTNLYYTEARVDANSNVAANTAARHNAVTLGTANGLSLSTQQLSLGLSSSSANGALSSTDWSTFSGKQNALSGTGIVKSTGGTISYLTDNSTNWNTAYNDSIISAGVTGTSTKTLTLNQQDGGTITASWSDADTGLTSVGLTMPSAFTVTNSPLTANGTLAVTGAGVASQYVRGDGTLAPFPTSTGGGSSVSYYFNGGTSQGTIGGNTYYEMSKTAVIGTGADFTINSNGYISQFVTDANDPSALTIPAGNWNFEMWFSASSGGGSPSFYLELYKYDGATLTLISSGSANPEVITGGTAIDLYTTALAVPTTALTLTDRLAVRVFVTHSSKTITLHTQNGHLCQAITTFSTGLTALNGLTNQVQYLAVGTSGTDFAVSSVTDTHTFNLPTASATNRGALNSTDWSIFNGKQNALTLTTTGTSGAATLVGATLNIPQYTDQYVGTVTSVSALTLGTTGTDLSSSVANGTTTPVITLNVPTASAVNRGALSSADWTIFNGKQNALTNPITGTGTTNYLPKFTGTSALGNSIIQENGTGIGIGGSANTKLEIIGSTDLLFNLTRAGIGTWGANVTSAGNFFLTNRFGTNVFEIADLGGATFASSVTAGDLIQTSYGTARIQVTSTTNSANSALRFGAKNASGTTKNAGLYYVSGATSADTFMSFAADDTNYQFNFLANGNCGIATTTPTALLQVKGESPVTPGARYLKTQIGGGNSWGLESFEELAVGFNGIRSIFSGGDNWDISFSAGTSTNWSSGTQPERMRITSAGNVGIGTTSPTQKLSVLGNTDFGNEASNVTAGGYTTRISGASLLSSGLYYGSYGSLILNANNEYTASSRRFLFTNALDGTKFAIVRSANATTDPSFGADGVLTSGTADFVITNTGNVGIATLRTPGEKLQVQGNIRLTGADIITANTLISEINSYAGSTNQFKTASIKLYTGSFVDQGFMTFNTSVSAADVERMRITEAGNVLIGTATDGPYKLDVNGAAIVSNGLTALSSSLTAPNIALNGFYASTNGNVNNYNGIVFQGVSITDMYFGRGVGSDDLVIHTNAGETARFRANGGADFAGAVAINNPVAAAIAVTSTHKVEIVIGGVTYYLLASDV
jgi:hypothetical protein